MKYSWMVPSMAIVLACGDGKMRMTNEGSADFKAAAIHLDPLESRPYVFTNKESAFYYGESGKIRASGHNGFHVLEHKYFDDYYIAVDEKLRSRETADSITHYFDHLSRFYKNEIEEHVSLLDHVKCLLVQFSAPTVHTYDFMPLISGVDEIDQYDVQWLDSKNLLIIAAKSDLAKGAKCAYPPYIGIKFSKSTSFIEDRSYGEDQIIPAFRPGKFRCTAKQLTIAVVVGRDVDEVKEITSNVMSNSETYLNRKKERIAQLLQKTYLETNQPYFDKAFQWAVVSMDQLLMNQEVRGQAVKGIFAGLPWFNNYWGRDTFISLPGALLVSGQIDEAKEVLRSFAQFQMQNPDDPNYGRIPNQTTTTDIVYNTADGTPFFVRALWQYYLYSGDQQFLEEMYPVVARSIEGTLKYHTDANHFLTHEDAETWMDARTIEGAWSPRGDRAVEVQALWYEQLLVASEINRVLGKTDSEQALASELRQKFEHFFWDERAKQLHDHLNADGSKDNKVRPNQIFVISIPQQQMIKTERELMVIKEVINKLTSRYGVASLWQHDPDFHPYHEYPGYYPKDEAYHNGTVWGWLAGPVISALVKYGYHELAYELLESESFQLLDWGASGTLSELLDAIPQNGNKIPKISGTVSQAWSLAEYIRNVYQDFLGISLDVPAHKITIAPRLPGKISSLKCKIPLKSDLIRLDFEKIGSEFEATVSYDKGEQDWLLVFKYPEARTNKIILEEKLSPGKTIKVNINFHRKAPVMINDEQSAYQVEKLIVPLNLFSYLTFSVPQLDRNLQCLKPRPYPMLLGPEVNAWNSAAKMIVDRTDPQFDDNGPNGQYLYPKNFNFKDGILDLTHFQVFVDQQYYYFRLKFRNLVQPGWHPEYGFQLTFAAIAIDQNSSGSGMKNIGRNANYQLPAPLAYNRIIYVGGGFQVEDEQGKILCQYVPTDIRYPLGSVAEKTISFAIPKKYLGEYREHWRFAIMVGAQDDHGGAGIGDFRNVVKEASEWQGGGGEQDANNTHVYDFSLPEN
ncbi:hypothetical protein L0Z72_01565 [candidate division KSB1 bacterium]|nr:hypothetical protein [candidate division KSB1 bacterium]